MRITKVNIPKDVKAINNDGLEAIKLDRLDSIVLIAGKNGSGKTRILNKIFETLGQKPNANELQQLKAQLENHTKNIKNWEGQITAYEQAKIAQPDRIPEYDAYILNNKQIIENSLSQKKGFELRLKWNQIETLEISNLYAYVHFVPKKLDLRDCNDFSINTLFSQANQTNVVGVDNLSNAVFAKIQVIQNNWFNTSHQNSTVDKEEKVKAKDDYDKLKGIIKLFLNTDIDRNASGDATLFGFRLGESKLSDGQKILLQFCLAIYSQEAALKDLILVLDEPENHLHPSVIIETIERIKECVTNGQIWIATHSVPLLAHFDPSLIWYVEEGKISYAGRTPEKVLASLLGDDNEIAKLQDFISLPSQLATSLYAFESLFEPRVVTTDSKDPQSLQIRERLLSIMKEGKLRVLDYGAGKGRLISNIAEFDESNQEKLISSLDYIAFDKYDNDKEQCKIVLEKVYGTSEKRYYNDINDLLSFHDNGSFNVVIMCNVLHEIDPNEWLDLFKPDGIITKLLSDDGFLLLVEDQQIPIGEKAYQKGFLVLDTPQIKELFKIITSTDTKFSSDDSRGDGRLKAHFIPKECLIRIDNTSRIAAIKALSKLAKSKIKDIRIKDERTYQSGKLHGFWTQQFANAQLNLAEME